MKKIIGLVACLFVGSANAGFIEHIENGGFEAGDFSDWTVVNTGTGHWSINDGTFDTGYNLIKKHPIDGAFDAVTTKGNGNPELQSLSQEILLPGSFSAAVLSWDDRIESDVASSNLVREWRVFIEGVDTTLLNYEVFSTVPEIGGISSRWAFDVTPFLTPFANETIRISFVHEDQNGSVSTTLDNVSFTTFTAEVPEPASLALLGLGLVGIGFLRRKKAA
ncbi:PEP-CTERM sorting domain-containing protein [Neptunomonas sp.]|uniref:PEP-CTERM sorting domain-containing protein n=1 Tax=Neptunomonas sp. TaxID=1971898 RepID=UPI003568A8C9